MNLSKEDQRYDKQWDLVDTFFNTNEPEGFGDAVVPEEAEALKAYYFVNFQKQDVYEHRKLLAANNPELAEKALVAARKIAVADGLSDEEIEEIFSSV
jgi:tellurite resistance protein